jgi:hypothetical protein
MIVLLVGATERAIGAVREVAGSSSPDIRIGASPDSPDWVMTSTADERAQAIRRYGLPSYRVVEFRALGTGEEPPQEVVRTALVRMAEIGRLPRPRPPLAAAIASRAMPLLTEWATQLATDEARQKIAAHMSFLQSKHGTARKGRMLFVAPDVPTFVALFGVLNQLSRERHQTHVSITHVSPGDPDLSSFQGLYTGLTVGRPPELHGSPWRPLARALRECLHAWHLLFGANGGVPAFESAIQRASPLATALARNRLLRAWPVRTVALRVMASIERALPLELGLVSLLEDRKPDVLVVVPHRSVESIEADYFRTARRLGIPSMSLPLRWDDLEVGGGLRYEAPDAIALWNEEQRREVMNDYRLSADRVRVTGALLPSDMIDRRTDVERDKYCHRLGIDPSRRIILLEAPAVSTRASISRFHEWRRVVEESTDPEVRRAVVVVYVHNPDEVAVWRRLASTAEIVVARAGTDQHRGLVRLHESLMPADVVMATDLTVLLEARARARPVIVLLDPDEDGDSELARFCRVHASRYGWPVVAWSVQEAVAQLSLVLASETAVRGLGQAAAVVPADHEASGALRVYRVLDELARRRPTNEAPSPPPAWQRLLILCCAALARRLDTSRNDHSPAKATLRPPA